MPSLLPGTWQILNEPEAANGIPGKPAYLLPSPPILNTYIASKEARDIPVA
jgi:hypothetical protein